jgi:hypothetical protein
VVPSLPSCLHAATVNEVRITALGDFPPAAARVTAAAPNARATLSVPSQTRVLEVDGLGPSGLAAFGRTAPFFLGELGARVPVAYGPPDTACATTTQLQYARAGHQATILPSGAVLVSGGYDLSGFAVPKLELYLPNGDATTAPGSFRVVDAGGRTALDAQAALGHAVALLPTGELLVTGGAPAVMGRASGIAYSGFTRHRADGLLAVGVPEVLPGGARAFHTATALADGRVLLAGGCAELTDGDCVPGRALASALLYSPITDTFGDAPPLGRARFGHQAILRGDGTVLLVGGRGEGNLALSAELYDPAAPRGIDAGTIGGAAALLPTGAVLSIAGDAASLWLGTSEIASLPALPAARGLSTVTALEDGSALIAGGDAPLLLYDGRGGLRELDGLPRHDLTATRLLDGTVLLAGGADAAGATRDAFVFLGSPLGPFSNLPLLTFEGRDTPVVLRRPDRARFVDGQLELTAPSAGEGGRPAELALVPLDLADVQLSLLAGRRGAGAAALILAWASDASWAFITVEPGQPVALFTVAPGQTGQTIVSPVAGCSGAALDDAELPDGDEASLSVSYQSGVLDVLTPARRLFRCFPKLGRGAVGVAALHGTVAFDNLAVTR